MGKTADSRATGARPDPVRSFNRWKKKHSHKQSQKKQLRKQLKKPEWQVEREVISRLMQNYEKVRPAPGRGRGAFVREPGPSPRDNRDTLPDSSPRPAGAVGGRGRRGAGTCPTLPTL